MAVFNKEFDNYLISYYSPQSPSILSTIHCYFGNTLQGVITFKKTGSPLADSTSGSNNVIQLEYYMDHFSRILDILRNETPLYMRYYEEKEYGWIISSREEVGEEES